MDTVHHTPANGPSIEEQLDAEYAPAWRPDPGDKLVGIVTEISEREGAFGVYPIVTVMGDDGETLAFHAFHEVAQNELARLAPKLGDAIGVKYLGKDEARGYHRYRVRRAASGDSAINWSRYGDGGTDEPLEPIAIDDGATQSALELERDERDAAMSELHRPLE
jgi:hypothetical protein